MRNLVATFILISSAFEVNAQVSYRSEVFKGSEYIEPYDRSVVNEALVYRQQKYDRNLSSVKNMVTLINDKIIELDRVNRLEARRINKKFESYLSYLNNNNIDYSINNNYSNVFISLRTCLTEVNEGFYK